MSLTLANILKKSYSTNAEAKKELLKYGYVLDQTLSNDNQKVFFNPKTKKLLVAVAGTHNLQDVGTDLYLAAGKLKETNRYKEAKKVLETARKRYPSASENVDIVGHSLGGGISSRIAKNKDNVITYGKGSTIGEKVRDNEKSYRVKGDAFSAFAPGVETIPKTVNTRSYFQGVQSVLDSHDLRNLDKQPIFIPQTKERPQLIYDPNAGDSVEFQNYGLDD
jgi:hypothetical protein